MTDFIAQRRINAPGSYAGAYGPGDPVAAQVVADWELKVPDDVLPAEGYVAPRPADDSDDRAAWETYVITQGTTPEEARAASLDDLKGMYEAPPEPEPAAHDLPATAAPEGVDGAGVQHPTPVTADNTPHPARDQDRPPTSATKAEWIEHVIAYGADPAWANSSDTTKADLMAWQADG